MLVVILNWKDGENDSFSPFNQALENYLDASGKCTKVVQLTDEDWPGQIVALKKNGIDFVFTWQGLGTRQTMKDGQQSFWDTVQVPLISLHGDHPCHMPGNHAFESPFCTHLYTNREFSQYANTHFRKQSRSIFIEHPLFNLDIPFDIKGPDCFVLAKNITSPMEMENKWKIELNKQLFDFCMRATEILKFQLSSSQFVDVHSIVDELIMTYHFDVLYPHVNLPAYHAIHSQLDFYCRNFKSVSILELLEDVPLHIYGRGWDYYSNKNNPNHQFFKGKNSIDSQELYYSKFGIIDISPSATGLHDRTYRAIRNGTPFLSSGYMPGFLPEMIRYDSLFYTFNKSDLRHKCENIMSNPTTHIEISGEFSYLYQMQSRPAEFVWKLDSIARSMAR